MKSDIPVANIVTKSYLGVDHKFILLRKRLTKRVEIRAPLKKAEVVGTLMKTFGVIL